VKLFSKVDIYICIQNLSAGDTLLACGSKLTIIIRPDILFRTRLSPGILSRCYSPPPGYFFLGGGYFIPLFCDTGNRCRFVLLDKDESCPTADLSNTGHPNGAVCCRRGTTHLNVMWAFEHAPGSTSVFYAKRYGNIPTETHLTKWSNPCGIWKIVDQYIALSRKWYRIGP